MIRPRPGLSGALFVAQRSEDGKKRERKTEKAPKKKSPKKFREYLSIKLILGLFIFLTFLRNLLAWRLGKLVLVCRLDRCANAFLSTVKSSLEVFLRRT